MANLIGMLHQKGISAAQEKDEYSLAGKNVPEIREKDIVRKHLTIRAF